MKLVDGKWIHFGDKRYQHYYDRIGLYSHLNHNDKKRRQAYFSRHSGISQKQAAIKRELKKSRGKITAKILSHRYLW